MKKKIISALMAALVVGVASPTFAAEIDDQVKELRDRVTELERDSQYNRNRVAELERDNQYNRNRVAELEDEIAERNSNDWSDRFSVNGEMRFRFWNLKNQADRTRMELRILPTMQINDNIALKARFTGWYENMNDDANSQWRMNFAYFDANYDQFNVQAGKMPLFTNVDNGMIADDFFSGVHGGVSNGNLNFGVNLGHWNVGGHYAGGEAIYTSDDEQMNVGVGYHYFKNGGVKNNIIAVGGGYQVTEDIKVSGAYAHNSKANNKKNAYNIEGTYLGADRHEKGTWGAYAAYRYVPRTVGLAPTYDTFKTDNKKGFEFGGDWTPVENTLLKASYFHGKTFDHVNDRTFFARASFFF